jgi:2-succinyl-5-enolpyruvyl-6-hydroxy-3-cyclohexene-1-carboxylate synthase
MNRFQPIYDIAGICAQKGIRQAVLCPGSRCAPLTLAFVRHPTIETYTVSDERSAAFIALGMAQQTDTPAIVLCTSGTAAYNFSPGVAEAFFSQTPLIVFTADRPAEWIAQHDGQTIHQPGIFGRHVKASFQLPLEYDHADSQWAVNRIVNEAINISLQYPPGPVHINAPFREPLYPEGEQVVFSDNVRVMTAHRQVFELTPIQKAVISNEWANYHNILVVAGQEPRDEKLLSTLSVFLEHHNIPLAADVISNLHGLEKTVRHAEVFLSQATTDVQKTLQPDLLITFGKSLISKNLKRFLRSHPPRAHWHIQPGGIPADTFQGITKIFEADPKAFFEFAAGIPRHETFEDQKQNNYHKLWEIESRSAQRALDQFFPQDTFAEFELVREILKNLPDDCNLHLANSMSVRYANLVGLQARQGNVCVWANRGTSGIDGCTSTAVGHALKSDVLNILITGDLAFFYDRNAFWHNHPLPNLRVVLLNNHGGVIFGMIDGPASLPEGDEYFVTRQKLNARKLCEEFGFDYLALEHKRKLKNLTKDFFESDGRTKILEIETDTQINKSIFESFKKQIQQRYEI